MLRKILGYIIKRVWGDPVIKMDVYRHYLLRHWMDGIISRPIKMNSYISTLIGQTTLSCVIHLPTLKVGFR